RHLIRQRRWICLERIPAELRVQPQAFGSCDLPVLLQPVGQHLTPQVVPGLLGQRQQQGVAARQPREPGVDGQRLTHRAWRAGGGGDSGAAPPGRRGFVGALRLYTAPAAAQLMTHPPLPLTVCPATSPFVASITATSANSSTVPKRPTGMSAGVARGLDLTVS